jgi:predicted flap endonuclease-1-like 5' DNA nuclease
MAKLKQQLPWLSAVLIVTVLSLGLVFGLGGTVEAQAFAPQPPVPAIPVQFGPESPRLAQAGGSNQVFRGDLDVEPGQVMRGDVTVYDGDVHINDGGQIQGNLVVYRGDIQIEAGGRVGGDVTAFSGDVQLDGQVGGDVASWSGDVDLASSARVEGGVSVLSGDIRRAEGAYVGGSVAQGPHLRLPRIPNPDFPAQPNTAVNRSGGFFGWIGQLFLRLIGAALLTALATLLVGVLVSARPDLISRTRGKMNESLALSFVVGLLANLVLLFLAGLLSVTICLLPIALIPILLIFGINLVGWSAVSQVAGERITGYVKQPVQPALTAAVGAIALTGVVTLLWAMGGCFRFAGFLALLGVASFGTGAVLLPWLDRGRLTGGPGGRTYTTGEPPAAPRSGPAAPSTASTPVASETAQPAAAVRDEAVLKEELAEPLDYVTAQDVLEAQAEDVQDDSFVRIKGIGPVFEQRLKNAGIRTFGELAVTPPERIAEIIGWPVDRVERSDINGQARYFSENR